MVSLRIIFWRFNNYEETGYGDDWLYCNSLCGGYNRYSVLCMRMGDLVESENAQAADALNDVFYKKYCKRNQKVFNFAQKAIIEHMKESEY